VSKMPIKVNGKKFKTVDDIFAKHTSLSKAELADIDLRVQLKGALIEAKQKGMTQEDIARIAGLKQSAVSRALSTESKVSTIAKIAAAMGYKLALNKEN